MTFVLLRAEYDRGKERAYVKFQQPDVDGGDAPIALVAELSNRQSGGAKPK